MLSRYLVLFIYSCILSVLADDSPKWTKIGETNSTFYIDTTERDFYAAEGDCTKNGGHLATIVDTTYQKVIFNGAKEKGVSSYWIGLTDTYKDAAFQWTSGYPSVSAVFWSSDPTGSKERLVDCIAVKVKDAKTTINVSMSWNMMDCSSKRPFVCMKGGLTGQLRPMPFVEKNGTCPDGFFRLSNRCLKIFADDHKNWTDASKACQALGKEGDLASILSQKEQNMLTALMLNQTSDVWIGLTKTLDHSYKWTRNYAVTYTHWKPREPNGGLSERCVMMYRRNTNPGEWNDVHCRAPMGYICESSLLDKPDGDSKQLPDPLFPPYSEASPCKKDEHLYYDFCYWKGKPVKSFEEGEAECNKDNKVAHLVSPHNLYEIAYLSAFVDKYGLHNALLGYKLIPPNKDNPAYDITSPDGIEIGVNMLRGVDYFHVENVSCLSTSLNDENHVETVPCTLKKGNFQAVCRYPLKTSSRHPDNFNFKCDDGWTKATGSRKCLKAFNDKLPFLEANKTCENAKGYLMSIHDAQEQSDVSSLAKTLTGGIWIGLVMTWDVNKQYDLHWTDKSPVNFYHWRNEEPSAPTGTKTENCVEVRDKSHDWNNVRCEKSRAYICYRDPKKADMQSSTATPTTTVSIPVTTIPDNASTTQNTSTPTSSTTTKPTSISTPSKGKTTPSSTPTTSSTTSATTPTTPADHTPSPHKTNCPSGMQEYFNYCYVVIEAVETWEAAKTKCNKMNAHVHLASIHDRSENQYITKLLNKSDVSPKEAWIGLSDLYNRYDDGFTYFSDHSAITFPNFDKDEKPSVFGDGGCIVIKPNGHWYTRHCTYKRPYVCKYSTTKPPKPVPHIPPKGAKYCIKGFTKFRDSCFKLVETPSIFTKAIDKCKSMVDPKYKSVTDLARIDSFEDNEFLFSRLKSIPGNHAWIGLHFHQNEFHWSNNDPMQYTRWPVNMSYVDQNTACVAIGIANLPNLGGYWFARSCVDKLPFICQTQMISKTPTSSNICPEGYDGFYENDGNCYYLNKERVTFEKAKSICDMKMLKNDNTAMTTSLLTLTSIYELSYIRAWLTINGITDRSIWLGLHLKKGNNVWKWENGQLVNFTFTSGFPDDPSGCFYFLLRKDHRLFGMQIDPECTRTAITVCKLSPRMKVSQPRECRMTPDGATYVGHQARTKSGRSCVRWDMVKDFRLRMKMSLSMIDGSVSSASNFCRYLPGVQPQMKGPFCFTSRGNATHHDPPAEPCDIEMCSQTAHGYVVVVAILVIVLLVTISFFVGVMVWKRTNTAQGFIPYLRQHDPEGGTSFHNPIYTPAATC